MTNKLTFCFSDEMIDTALRANGWSEGWTDEYWVHESNEYADHATDSKKQAFAKMLYDKNLIPKNVEMCWS